MVRHPKKNDELDAQKIAFVSMIKHYANTGEGLGEIREFLLVNANPIVPLKNQGIEYLFLPSDLDDLRGKFRFTYTDGVLTHVEFISDDSTDYLAEWGASPPSRQNRIDF